MAETDLQQTIIDQAQSPEQVMVDGTSTKMRPLSELIEAQRFLRNSQERTTLPVRFAKVIPGGAA